MIHKEPGLPRSLTTPRNDNPLQSDTHINELLALEAQRQQSTINLIASENYTSPAVREATASVLTNKYAEGYPGKRYYAGCAIIDRVEQLAIERCKQLFGCEHANVQPHAGSQANFAVYHALLQPGDTVMGMDLAAGGHLTHGLPVNMSGTLYNWVSYGVNRETEQIDYDEIARLAHKHKPKLIVAGASAYPRTIDFETLGAIARQIGAYFMADIAHIAGLVAAGLHPHPFPHADVVTSTTHKTLRGPRGGLIMCKAELAERIDRAIMPGSQGGPFMHAIAAKAVAFSEALQPHFAQYQASVIANARALAHAFQELGYRVTSGGTDNHLLVIDLRSKHITGRQAERILESVGITVSRSCIPFDSEKPWITSGIRIGSPAVTTRGMHTADMHTIVHQIDQALTHHHDEAKLREIEKQVRALCAHYPCP